MCAKTSDSVKNCFIIMPITTPTNMIQQYNNDSDHFIHVLDNIFIPAIKEAGFNPIPPIKSGSDIIPAEIMSDLEKSDLVLCDISTFNPNVFFELGIRTALNKPVCYVKDTLTKDIPFDNTIVHHHTYNSDLSSWIVKLEIPELAKHIINSYERSDDKNKLWFYFGIRSMAEPVKISNGIDQQTELLRMEIQRLGNVVSQLSKIEDRSIVNEISHMPYDQLFLRKVLMNTELNKIATEYNTELKDCYDAYPNVSLLFSRKPNEKNIFELKIIYILTKKFGYNRPEIGYYSMLKNNVQTEEKVE